MPMNFSCKKVMTDCLRNVSSKFNSLLGIEESISSGHCSQYDYGTQDKSNVNGSILSDKPDILTQSKILVYYNEDNQRDILLESVGHDANPCKFNS